MSAQRGNPEDESLVAAALASALLNVRVAGIGTVKSYDDSTKTCSVQPMVKRPLETDEGDVVQTASPVVQNVMVAQWGGSGLSANSVLVAGDAVLLVYLDYGATAWRGTGKVSDAVDTHKHGPSYPVAVPFVRPSGGPGSNAGNSIGFESGVRIHFTASIARVGGASDAEDFVALKSAVDAIQQNLDTMASFGTAFGPTTPGNLAPAGAQASSTKLKA